jgi:hypothetical protein
MSTKYAPPGFGRGFLLSGHKWTKNQGARGCTPRALEGVHRGNFPCESLRGSMFVMSTNLRFLVNDDSARRLPGVALAKPGSRELASFDWQALNRFRC